MNLWLIIWIYIFAIASIKELQMLGCGPNLLDVIFYNPYRNKNLNRGLCGSDNFQLMNLIRQHPQKIFEINRHIIQWRKSFILATIIVVLTMAILDNKNIKCGFLATLISTGLLYFSSSFYDYHLYSILNETAKTYFKSLD